MKSISIVVPLFNEEGNVKNLHREITEVCVENKYDYEIIFVDDGSNDNTYEYAKDLAPLTLIRFRRNFGQTAAMDAGIKQARNDYIITMDGDSQNDPNDIPRLIAHLEERDLDIVSGWRKDRKDPFLKRFVSRGANLLRKVIINDGIHDSGCSLKIYKRGCFENISIYGEMHRFIPALLKIRGFSLGEIVVNHRPRVVGMTKYNWKRTLKGLIDIIAVWFWNRYAVRPLHLLGSIGLLFVTTGLLLGLFTLYEFFKGQSLSDTALPLLTAFFLISGIQVFLFGLMTDILSKSYYEHSKGESYSVKNIVEHRGATLKDPDSSA